MESCMNCEYWIGKNEKCDKQPICTIPPGKARPSYCGKMPDGADCAGCPWYGKEDL